MVVRRPPGPAPTTMIRFLGAAEGEEEELLLVLVVVVVVVMVLAMIERSIFDYAGCCYAYLSMCLT